MMDGAICAARLFQRNKERLWRVATEIGDLGDLAIHLYQFNGEEIVRDGVFRYPKAMRFSQGIRIVGRR